MRSYGEIGDGGFDDFIVVVGVEAFEVGGGDGGEREAVDEEREEGEEGDEVEERVAASRDEE